MWWNMNKSKVKHFLHHHPIKKALCYIYYVFIMCGMWHGFQIYFDFCVAHFTIQKEVFVYNVMKLKVLKLYGDHFSEWEAE
jgi:hypothetical protein